MDKLQKKIYAPVRTAALARQEQAKAALERRNPERYKRVPSHTRKPVPR